ncbi:MAG: ABC transporter ATP-binding protein [Coprothermobacterota bacterium]|nr:ABC transporter ATP-binding protein [Coprothermobacterota bacterium]
MNAVIVIQDVTKTYSLSRDFSVKALRGVSFQIEEGEFVAIMGPSGSGKSTLMNILGCLDVASSGVYLLDGIDTRQMTDNQLARLRNHKIGFIFQNFNLLPRTIALENVELPLVYNGTRNTRKLAEDALRKVGLGDRLMHKPNELSIGQQQRVAIARALVTNPSLILADEPTGNLDTRSSEEVMAIIQGLNEEGRTIVMVTHEPDIGQHAKRLLRVRDGLVTVDEEVKNRLDARALLAAIPLEESL